MLQSGAYWPEIWNQTKGFKWVIILIYLYKAGITSCWLQMPNLGPWHKNIKENKI
jgi:hypothetical protein